MQKGHLLIDKKNFNKIAQLFTMPGGKFTFDGKQIVQAMDEFNDLVIKSKNIRLIKKNDLIVCYLAVNPNTDLQDPIEHSSVSEDIINSDEWEQVFTININKNQFIEQSREFIGENPILIYLNSNIPKLIEDGIRKMEGRKQKEEEKKKQEEKARREHLISMIKKYKKINEDI